MLSQSLGIGRLKWLLLLALLGQVRAVCAWQNGPQPVRAGRPAVDPQNPNQYLPYGPVPPPPQQPAAAVRPDGWPSSTVSDRAPPNSAPAGNYPTADSALRERGLDAGAALQPINDVQVLATVWSDPILASDIMPYVNDVFAANKEQIPPQEWDRIRTMLVKQRLNQLIETKTLVNDAKRTIPKENIKNVEKKVTEVYDSQEIPKHLKKANCTSRAELDAKLRSVGTCIDRERQSYFEKTLAQQWLLEKVRPEKLAEVTKEDMLAYYREHLADYESPPKARWQQITVRTGRTRSPQQAWDMAGQLGNMVLSGMPFEQVARQHSEGVTAADGGNRDWTNKGSLVSKPLDQALFTLQVGALSNRIEDEQGIHIIRVIERFDTTRVPFTEAQVGIKEKIKKQRQQEKISEYMVELKKQTPVWTIFDGQEEPKLTEKPTAAPR